MNGSASLRLVVGAIVFKVEEEQVAIRQVSFALTLYHAATDTPDFSRQTCIIRFHGRPDKMDQISRQCRAYADTRFTSVAERSISRGGRSRWRIRSISVRNATFPSSAQGCRTVVIGTFEPRA